jgi:hypothetical protein
MAGSGFFRGEPTLRSVLLIVASIRLIVWISGALAYRSIAHLPPTPLRGDYPMMAWDALHYLEILTAWYPNEGSIPSLIAFFPGLPLLATPLSYLVGGAAALQLVASVTAIIGSALVFVWARARIGSRAAFAAVLLLSCYPASAYFSSAYTEGPMLCATAAAFLLSDRGHHWGAALVAGVGSALRPTGFLTSQLVLFWTARSWAKSRPRRWLLLLAALALVSISGAVLYQGYLTVTYGRIDAYQVAQRNWESKPTTTTTSAAVPDAAPAPLPADDLKQPKRNSLFEALAAPGTLNKPLLLGILLVACFGLLRPGNIPRESYLLPILIFLVAYIPGQGVRIMSISRFETAAIPCFALMGTYLSRYPPLLYTIAAVGLLFECLISSQFARGYWTG